MLSEEQLFGRCSALSDRLDSSQVVECVAPGAVAIHTVRTVRAADSRGGHSREWSGSAREASSKGKRTLLNKEDNSVRMGRGSCVKISAAVWDEVNSQSAERDEVRWYLLTSLLDTLRSQLTPHRLDMGNLDVS